MNQHNCATDSSPGCFGPTKNITLASNRASVAIAIAFSTACVLASNADRTSSSVGGTGGKFGGHCHWSASAAAIPPWPSVKMNESSRAVFTLGNGR
jgi:hypothetical protein